MIYLDHPATSWPKPACVIQAMSDFLESAGGNPGRSGHRLSVAAGRIIYETRESFAHFLGAPNADWVIFMPNATYALNMVIQTVLRPGDTALTTSIEHNAVMRPLRNLEANGVRLLIAPCSSAGEVEKDAFRKLVKDTRLVILNHASNVIGQITPVAELAGAAREAGAMVLVDAAQTAGAVPIDVREMGVDFLAFTGHKALQGPPGTGGLVLCTDRAAREIKPLVRGGTGSSSDSEEQPDLLPDKFESGTPNGAGIAGLGAALQWITQRSLSSIQEHHQKLTALLLRRLADIEGVEVFGPAVGTERAPLISFRVRGKSVSEVGTRLDEEHGVLSRVGLHCAPAAHKTLGTFPEGTIRFGIGPLTSSQDIVQAADAVGEIAGNE